MRKTSVYILISLLAVLAIAALFLANFKPAVPPSGVPLQDGTQLIVEKVSFGTKHEMERRYFQRPLPFPTKSRFSTQMNEPGLAVFLSHYDPETGLYLQRNTLSVLVAVDEHGCRFVGSSAATARLGPNFTVQVFRFPQFPRSSKDLSVEVYGMNRQQICTIPVALPPEVVGGGSDEPSDWKPDPLPATRTAGGLSVTLASVSGRLSTGHRNGVAYTNLWVQPKFSFAEEGTPTDKWYTRDYVFTDPTGNEDRSPQPNLCRFEPAWRMKARFFRSSGAQFLPSEVWDVGKIKVPKEGEAEPMSMMTTLHGISMELLAAAGAGQTVYPTPEANRRSYASYSTSGSFHLGDRQNIRFKIESDVQGKSRTNNVTSEVPHICITANKSLEDFEASLLATDSRGANRDTHLSRVVMAGPRDERWNYWIAFFDAKEGEVIDLRLILQKGRELEFFIKPPKTEGTAE